MNNTVDYESFFSLIEIEENEKESAVEFINYRGLNEHIELATFLSSFISVRKPTYKEVATSFRYDKRLRRILFKYIGVLEEYFRSFLCNSFSSPHDFGIVTSNSLFDYCNESLFSKIVSIVWSLNSETKTALFEGKNILKKNLDALVKLRNVISHNRTLVNYRDFKEVNLTNGEVGNSLLINLKNLHALLPHKFADSFVKEINTASRRGERKRKNQTEWSLVSFIIVRL